MFGWFKLAEKPQRQTATRRVWRVQLRDTYLTMPKGTTLRFDTDTFRFFTPSTEEGPPELMAVFPITQVAGVWRIMETYDV